MAAPAALQRSVVFPAGRHTASLIFLHGSGGCFHPLLSPATPGRGAGFGGRLVPLRKGAGVPPEGGSPPTAGLAGLPPPPARRGPLPCRECGGAGAGSVGPFEPRRPGTA